MRKALGRNAFESQLREYITERTNMLDDFMKTELDNFINNKISISTQTYI